MSRRATGRGNKTKYIPSPTAAQYNVQNIVEVVEHKQEDYDTWYYCKTKAGRGITKTIWINSNNPKMINKSTIIRGRVFAKYFEKNGYKDRGSFERSLIIKSKPDTVHCVIKANVVFNDDSSKKANITLNKDYPQDILGSFGEIPKEDLILATKRSQVFPITLIDNTEIIYAVDEDGGRAVQHRNVSSKHIKWGPAMKQSNTKQRKKAQSSYKPGSLDLIFYTKDYATKSGYLEHADKSATNISSVGMNKEDVMKLQNENKIHRAQPKSLPSSTTNEKDVSKTNKEDEEESHDGSYNSSFMSDRGHDNNSDYRYTYGIYASSEEPQDKYEEACSKLKRMKRRNKRMRVDNEYLNTKLQSKKREISNLRQKVNRLEQELKEIRQRVTGSRSRERYNSSNRDRYRKRKDTYKRRRAHCSSDYSSTDEETSSTDELYRWDTRRKGRKDRKIKKDKRVAGDKNESKSKYLRNTVEKLLRVHAAWSAADKACVPVGHYALHYDKETGQQAACKDSTELYLAKSLLKFCEKKSIRIKESEANKSLKQWGAENLPTGITCSGAIASIKIGKDDKAPPDWLIIKAEQNNDDQ